MSYSPRTTASLCLATATWMLTAAGCGMVADMQHMRRNTDDMAQTTHDVKSSTDQVSERTDQVARDTRDVRATTAEVGSATREMNQSTKDMKDATERMAAKTDALAQDTRAMRQAAENLNQTTKDLKSATDQVAAKTVEMAKTTQDVKAATDAVAKKEDQLVQSTEAVKSATEKMGTTIEDLSKQSTAMRKDIGSLYQDLRQGDALKVRGEALNRMVAAQTLQEKLASAAKYFVAFEFQLWKGTGADNAGRLDLLRRDAVTELLYAVDAYVGPNSDSWSVSPAARDAKSLNLYALVATLDMVNTNQQTEEGGVATEAIAGGMMTLLTDGLGARASLDSGKLLESDLPKYQEAVLLAEAKAQYLIQLRQNVLPALLVNQLATTGSKTLSELELVGMALFPWTAKVGEKERNLAELQYFATLLDKTLVARDALVKMGRPVRMDEGLVVVLKNLRFPDGETFTSARREALAGLQRRLDRLLKDN